MHAPLAQKKDAQSSFKPHFAPIAPGLGLGRRHCTPSQRMVSGHGEPSAHRGEQYEWGESGGRRHVAWRQVPSYQQRAPGAALNPFVAAT
ncbi:MAG: hypothetical protein NVS3B10_25080 [Polyangiales bacterium]